MPFVIRDVLQHKRNDRQIREIHEREYQKYLVTLRQQTHPQPPAHAHPYYLSSKHVEEVERSRVRSAQAKQTQYTRIQQENFLLYDRLLKAGQRPSVDDRNRAYEHNLESFNSKRFQQRVNQYKRIDTDNQLLLQRINTARGRLLSKEQCDRDWQKHLVVMKKTCDYPENIDRFVSKPPKYERKHTCLYSRLRSAQWDSRHNVNEPASRLNATPLMMILNRVE